MERPLIPNDLAHLDPGIVDVVERLRKAGLTTTDSGDGESKLPGGHWDKLGFQPYDKADIMPYPHVAMQTETPDLADAIYTIGSVLGEAWSIEVSHLIGEDWLIVAYNAVEHRHIERLAYEMSEALRAHMRDMLKRIRDDISNGTAPLNDVWWFDDATKMEDAITEALS